MPTSERILTLQPVLVINGKVGAHTFPESQYWSPFIIIRRNETLRKKSTGDARPPKEARLGWSMLIYVLRRPDMKRLDGTQFSFPNRQPGKSHSRHEIVKPKIIMKYDCFKDKLKQRAII